MSAPMRATSGIVPHLVVDGGAEAIEFYKKAFGAEVTELHLAADEKRVAHAGLFLNGQHVYVCDDFPELRNGVSSLPDLTKPAAVTLRLQVADCDAVYQQAMAAGASAIMPPADVPWGDRYAIIRDPFGHIWSIAHALKAAE
ncbi:MAG: VOC family protein [Bryobacter sp.]|nr:VOC family protein [Bryobacter sp.]